MKRQLTFFLAAATAALAVQTAAAPSVVVIHGEPEYGSARTMPELAAALASQFGWETTVLTSPEGTKKLPDLSPLSSADLLILFIRFREATEEQRAQLKAYFGAGKPAVAFRTTSHAFWGDKGWFVPFFGGHYKGHAPNEAGTTAVVPADAVNHPILKGVAGAFHVGHGGTYNAQPLSDFTNLILLGKTNDLPAEPVAWTASPNDGQRLFYTSLGAADNFESRSFTKMILNACQWCLGETAPPTTDARPFDLPAAPERAAAPDATVLFDGDDLGQWRHWDPSTRPRAIRIDQRADTTSGGPVYEEARWKVSRQAVVARPGYGDILTENSFGDSVYHLDFLIPDEPSHVKGKFRGNSGVFIDGKWEIQIIDSYGADQLDDQLTCGAIYGVAAPSTNACGKPGTWQQLQVAVKHVGEEAADLSVWLNGVQIHDRVRVEGRTLYGFETEGEEEEEDEMPTAWFVADEEQSKQCDLGKDFTVVMRFRTEEQGPLFSKMSADGKHRENDKVLFIEDSRLHYDIGWVGSMASDKDVNDGDWHTVVLRSRGGLAQIYLDGEKLAEKKGFTAPDNEGSVVKVAAAAMDFPEQARHWEGTIDSFQFFAEALSDQDIELTGSSEPIERATPVLAWSGSDAAALRIVRGDHARRLNMGKEFSMAVRFRTYESGPLFAKAPAHGHWEPDGKALFVQRGRLIYDIGWLGAIEAEEVEVNDGHWHIAAVTHKRGRTRLYLDGKRVARQEDFGRPDDASHVFKLGACAANFPKAGQRRFPGHISHAVFFRKELSRQAVQGLSEGDLDEEQILFLYENEAIEDEALEKPEGTDEDEGREVEEADRDEEAEEEKEELREGEEEGEPLARGPLRLQADTSKVCFANITVRPLAEVDHAGIISAWDDAAFSRGQKIYQGLCFACHGNLEKAGSLPTSRPFWEEPFKNGKDPWSLYLTVKKGYNQMPPQPWLTPSAAYDVIHYIREDFVRTKNKSEYVEITPAYLASLPKGMGTQGALTREQMDYAKGPKYKRMNFGPMLNWTLEVAPGNIAYKAIAVRLDHGPGGVSRGRHWMVYDHDTMRLAAAWSGEEFIDWKGIAFDQSHGTHASIVGDKTLVNPVGPGWANPADGSWADPRFLGRDGKPYGPLPRRWTQFKGQYIYGDKIVIKYTVGDALVLEMPGLVQGDPIPVFSRTLNIGKSSHDLQLRVSPAEVMALIVGKSAATIEVRDGYQVMTVPARETPTNIKLLSSKADAQGLFIASLLAGEPEDLRKYTRGGPAHWSEVTVTRGKMGQDEDAFAVDEITYPAENPYYSWMRIGGFDFLPGGKRGAVATWLGDVWIVDGIDGDFREHTWKRICSGLFQPLGVKWVDGHIYITCRDQLAKLHDFNGDEETDFVECFNNDHQVTEHFHEFAMGLQTDDAGNFYYAKSARHAKTALVPHHGTLLRVSKDGSTTEILATGFRAANGVCLNPDGTYVVTDQEGHWNPKNRINYVKEGGFYGNMYGYHDVTDESDNAMDQPLCWITNAFDRSPGELLWVPKDAAWGELNGKLLNLSYGTGRVFAVPHEKMKDGQAQGGMVSLGLDFPTGIMRGRFHPDNGQLYTTGMFAWAGNKHQDGGFYRIRSTGKAKNLPIGLKARPTGIELGFSDPLDRESASHPENYQIKIWGLKRTKSYGSKHYDEKALEVAGATVSADGKSVFLSIPDITTTWCMEIAMAIKDANGNQVRRVIHNTIHQLEEKKAPSRNN